MKNYCVVFGLILVFFLSSCASQSGWTPTVDPSTSPASYPSQPYPQVQNQYPPPPPPQPRPVAPAPRHVRPAPKVKVAPAPVPSSPPQRSYTQDLAECKMLAQQVSGYTPGETIKGGLIGGAIGAAAGAAIGAATGNAGKGAAIGAAAGGIGGGAYKGIDAERKYKDAYIRCMRNRGWNVINP